MDGQGSISPLDLDAMRSLSKQRLPIQSKHVEALLEYVERIEREARAEGRNKGLEEAAQLCSKKSSAMMETSQSVYLSEFGGWYMKHLISVVEHTGVQIRALKDKGE